jgi:hypothetical protein
MKKRMSMGDNFSIQNIPPLTLALSHGEGIPKHPNPHLTSPAGEEYQFYSTFSYAFNSEKPFCSNDN